jgi:hypothetical protein
MAAAVAAAAAAVVVVAAAAVEVVVGEVSVRWEGQQRTRNAAASLGDSVGGENHTATAVVAAVAVVVEAELAGAAAAAAAVEVEAIRRRVIAKKKLATQFNGISHLCRSICC